MCLLTGKGTTDVRYHETIWKLQSGPRPAAEFDADLASCRASPFQKTSTHLCQTPRERCGNGTRLSRPTSNFLPILFGDPVGHVLPLFGVVLDACARQG